MHTTPPSTFRQLDCTPRHKAHFVTGLWSVLCHETWRKLIALAPRLTLPHSFPLAHWRVFPVGSREHRNVLNATVIA